MTKSLLSSLIFSEAANLGLKAEIKEKKKRTQQHRVQQEKESFEGLQMLPKLLVWHTLTSAAPAFVN